MHLLARSPASLIFRRSSSSSISSNSSAVCNYVIAQLDRFLSSPHCPTRDCLSRSHALIITSGNSANPFFSAKLIYLYASSNSPFSSIEIFRGTPNKDAFLWNSIIKSHFSNGLYSRSLELFSEMRSADCLPNHFTLPMVASACGEAGWPNFGMCVHGLASKCGLLGCSSAVGSSLVYMYSKSGEIGDACKIFDEMPDRDVVAWTAVLVGCLQNGEEEKGLEFLCEMLSCDVRPNSRTMEGAFQACGNMGALLEGSCLHGLMVKNGAGSSPVVQSSVLSMYTKCECPDEAYRSFCEVVDKNIFTWTSVIGVHARVGKMRECISLFHQMQDAEFYPDRIVISCMLLGFGNSMNVLEGKTFHGLVLRRRYLFDQMVDNALLSMYCKFRQLDIANKLFDRGNKLDKERWNIMVLGYGKIGLEENCIKLFKEMHYLGIEADSNSLVSVISSSSRMRENSIGRQFHCYAIKCLMDSDVSVANSLIDFYGSCGDLSMAHSIFSKAMRDVVSWNTLMSAYAHNKRYVDAISLFNRMRLKGISPNSATLVTVLSACSNLASLEDGERIHQFITENQFKLNVSLATALIDMYAKCGKLEKSRQIFDSMNKRDVISWNVMISCYGMHGDAKSAIDVFQLMENSNRRPNNLTFLGLLSACAHSGLVKEGKYLFDRMESYSIKPDLKHYACMVDLLGKSGDLKGAEELVLSMPMSPDGGIWGALLSACRIHGEIDIGVRVAKHAIESDPGNDGYYVLLSNMCTSIGRWEEAEMVRRTMKGRIEERRAGWSAI
ncbi:pentatricopeptide repeat-containing protein At4g39952, mitochondrial [Punica granatum]|nr:pentatricopeptide repeat-containing protein At4g39952, mitochondrial [Punica granatum]